MFVARVSAPVAGGRPVYVFLVSPQSRAVWVHSASHSTLVFFPQKTQTTFPLLPDIVSVFFDSLGRPAGRSPLLYVNPLVPLLLCLSSSTPLCPHSPPPLSLAIRYPVRKTPPHSPLVHHSFARSFIFVCSLSFVRLRLLLLSVFSCWCLCMCPRPRLLTVVGVQQWHVGR